MDVEQWYATINCALNLDPRSFFFSFFLLFQPSAAHNPSFGILLAHLGYLIIGGYSIVLFACFFKTCWESLNLHCFVYVVVIRDVLLVSRL